MLCWRRRLLGRWLRAGSGRRRLASCAQPRSQCHTPTAARPPASGCRAAAQPAEGGAQRAELPNREPRPCPAAAALCRRALSLLRQWAPRSGSGNPSGPPEAGPARPPPRQARPQGAPVNSNTSPLPTPARHAARGTLRALQGPRTRAASPGSSAQGPHPGQLGGGSCTVPEAGSGPARRAEKAKQCASLCPLLPPLPRWEPGGCPTPAPPAITASQLPSVGPSVLITGSKPNCAWKRGLGHEMERGGNIGWLVKIRE